MYLQSSHNLYHQPLQRLIWYMLPLPSLALQLTSVGWLIAGCSREHHFFNKYLIWKWLPSLLISSSCFFIISFYDLPPSHTRRSISPAHDSDSPLTAPVCPNADPLAPWFRRNYAGKNDGSPRMYFSTLSAEPSGRGPGARQSLCALQEGESVLPKFALEDKETWCFYFRIITKQQHTSIFVPVRPTGLLQSLTTDLKMFIPHLWLSEFDLWNVFKWAILIPSRELPGAHSCLLLYVAPRGKCRDFLRNRTFTPILAFPQLQIWSGVSEFGEIILNFWILSLKKKKISEANLVRARF